MAKESITLLLSCMILGKASGVSMSELLSPSSHGACAPFQRNDEREIMVFQGNKLYHGVIQLQLITLQPTILSI